MIATTKKPVLASAKPISIAPGGLTFDLRDCEACYHRQVTKAWKKPRSPMASIYNKIDSAMKNGFHGKTTTELGLRGVPHGTIYCKNPETGKEWRVKSTEIPTLEHNFVLAGKPDALIEFYDGTWGVIDFKTSDPFDSQTGMLKAGYVNGYAPQLDSYRLALQKPAKGEPREVSWLGLITLSPRTLTLATTEQPAANALSIDLTVLPLECSRSREAAMLSQIAELLDHPPADRNDCRYCQLRRTELGTTEPADGIISGLLSL